MAQTAEGRAARESHSVEFDAWTTIENQLSKWLADPTSAVDPDAVPPSQGSLEIALAYLSRCSDNHQAVPAAVVPDGNGGLVFEWQCGNDARTIEIDPAGHAEEVLFSNGRRISRLPLAMV